MRWHKASFFQFLWTGCWLTVLFVTIYGTTNWLADSAAIKYRFYFSWELSLPLIPWMILPYNSLNLLTAMPMFYLHPGELRRLGRALGLATLIAGVCFYLFPAPIGFTRPASVPGWDFLYHIVWSLDRTSNTLPSLHITYSALTIMALWRRCGSLAQAAFFIWFLVICCSVVFTWQHHVLDVVGGILLAALCHLFVGKTPVEENFRWTL